jgi:catechol 2,3-dioxygenase-like lactoylglutathione lyase family enzyme
MKRRMPIQPMVRGIDHLGITVPDVESATHYFVSAFGAEVLYDVLSPSETPLGGPEIEAAVGIAAGTVVRAIRLLRLHEGPSLELFEYEASSQKASAIPSDFGLQHMALYVDDIAAGAERVQQAGGQLLAGPVDLPEIEGGPGNQFWYTRAPWGMTIELITYPAPQSYERTTQKRRWKPDASG